MMKIWGRFEHLNDKVHIFVFSFLYLNFEISFNIEWLNRLLWVRIHCIDHKTNYKTTYITHVYPPKFGHVMYIFQWQVKILGRVSVPLQMLISIEINNVGHSCSRWMCLIFNRRRVLTCTHLQYLYGLHQVHKSYFIYLCFETWLFTLSNVTKRIKIHS